jgi:hypothetical protein
VNRHAILTNLLVVTILLGVLIASRMWRSDEGFEYKVIGV